MLINNNWNSILEQEFKKEYFKNLISFIDKEYEKDEIFPSKNEIFNAFKLTDYENVKVVILGQDPYHGYDEAEGLAFSVKNHIKRPPSLRNIFKELKNDLNIDRENNSLQDWASQGVLLLNAILTVKKDTPLSHKNIGWEQFTDEVIKIINKKEEPVVFVLWGNFAKTKKNLITNKKHLILEGAHPSPFSANRGFFGTKPFSQINKFLKENNIKEIRW
jgi:uracil-DNA glycosylase